MISNYRFGESCDEYQRETGRDPRRDYNGNIRPQVQIVRTLNEWRRQRDN